MLQEKRIQLTSIQAILPQEIFVMILKNLGFKSITICRRVCHYWNRIIVDFQLTEVASSKFDLLFIILF